MMHQPLELDSKKPKKQNKIILAVVILVVATLLSKLIYGQSWKISIIAGIISLLLLIGLISLDKKSPKKEDKEELIRKIKEIPSKELRETIEKNKQFNKQGEKIIEKRGDLTFQEKIGRELMYIFSSGLVILLLGLFYLGSIPTYFGVNNELINPTLNVTFQDSLDLAQNITTEKIIYRFNDIGSQHPKFWFWCWWIGVVLLFIIPIAKIIFYTIKRIMKGG